LGLDAGPVIAAHFREAARTESQDISELFRSGRKALLIGLLILSLCLFLAWYFTYHVTQRPMTRLIQESFVILGWVSMWKPIEIFLYEWLPIARRRRLFLRISSANVTSRSSETS
jgi:ABC-type spermidine/putrescine transport system permease subunit I